MTAGDLRYSYGPVPSRRLGKSLGVNNIPAKVCTYACIYCQVGRTTKMQIERGVFYEPDNIFRDVQIRLTKAHAAAERADYLTFVPDGEPTLDLNLGQEIKLLKTLQVPIGVITNGSLMGRDDVREDLAKADWVSLKIDAVRDSIWRRMNRPHKSLRLFSILDGMLEFAKAFAGNLVTETMLVRGINESDDHIGEIARFIHKLEPAAAYLSIPTRPPAERWGQGPDEERINRAYQVFSEKIQHVEYLIGYEGDAFAYTDDIEKDILSITAVHPMRKEALSKLLSRAGAAWDLVDRLVAGGDLTVSEYEGHVFYLRRFNKV
jgi:wyosine [tRNA(Phe)-imidazoG37] synthetase (radical SAM superfamily)